MGYITAAPQQVVCFVTEAPHSRTAIVGYIAAAYLSLTAKVGLYNGSTAASAVLQNVSSQQLLGYITAATMQTMSYITAAKFHRDQLLAT